MKQKENKGYKKITKKGITNGFNKNGLTEKMFNFTHNKRNAIKNCADTIFHLSISKTSKN